MTFQNTAVYLSRRELGVLNRREITQQELTLEVRNALLLNHDQFNVFTQALMGCSTSELERLATNQIAPSMVFTCGLGVQAKAAVLDWIAEQWLPTLPSDGTPQDEFAARILNQLAGEGDPQGVVCRDGFYFGTLARIRGMSPVFYSALERNTRSENTPARTALAANPDISPALAHMLSARQEHVRVRTAAAGNPNLGPQRALEMTQTDESEQVQCEIARCYAANHPQIRDALVALNHPRINSAVRIAMGEPMAARRSLF